jgi:hypothetical protein
LNPPSTRRPSFADLACGCAVTLSHGRTGQCWDNALAESFFAAIKGELLDHQPWPARAAVRRTVVEYTGWYNGSRLIAPSAIRHPPNSSTQQDQEGSLTESSALSVKAGNPNHLPAIV